MRLLSFMARSSKGWAALAVCAGIVAGVSNGALLALVNSLLGTAWDRRGALLWPYAGLCLLMLLSRTTSEILLLRLSHKASFRLRMELSRRILATPLRRLEELGTHRLLATLTEDIPVIAETLSGLAVVCMQVTVVASVLVYLGWLSPTLLLWVLGFMTLGVVTYQVVMSRGLRRLRLVRELWDSLVGSYRAITEGVKELQLHYPRRRQFLEQVLAPTAEAVRRHNVGAISMIIAASSWGHLLFFILIGVLLFVAGGGPAEDARTLTGYVIAILYLIGPLQIILNLVPGLGRAGVAVRKIEQLGLSLAPAGADAAPPPAAPPWERLELAGVTHVYRQERENSSFMLGPIDLTFRPGELVFLVGGNGSGKTTMAKLLVGLYAPESGEVRLNGLAVTDAGREAYRQHFSVIFSDFFLFPTLLGLPAEGLDARARDYLERLHLDRQVRLDEGELSTTDLSRGQRKRLALLTAYLEDRPFYVFDEWAADQDPLFKEIFYLQLLPELKARGKTVLAISHDDHYYHLADRVIKLDYGKIESDTPARDFSYAARPAPVAT